MKKVGTIIAGISLFLVISVAGAWAATIILTGAGGGPNLTYDTSPSVDVNYTNNANADTFIIVSANSKGTMAYGILSTYSGYYQETIEVGAACPDATTDTINGMTAFGAGGAS